MKSWVRVICELHFAIVKTHPIFAQRHTRSLCRDTPCLWAEILPVFVQRHIQSLCRYTQSLRRDTSGLCVETHPVLVQTHTVLHRDTPGLGAKTHSVLRRDIPGLVLCAETHPVLHRHTPSLWAECELLLFFTSLLTVALTKWPCCRVYLVISYTVSDIIFITNFCPLINVEINSKLDRKAKEWIYWFLMLKNRNQWLFNPNYSMVYFKYAYYGYQTQAHFR